MVFPGATKFLIDDVVVGGREDLLPYLVFAVALATVVQAAGSFLSNRTVGVAGHRMVMDLRNRLQDHIGHLDLRFHDQNSTGALVSRVMTDSEGVKNLLGTGMVQLLGSALTALFAFCILLYLNAWLALVAMSFLAMFGVLLQTCFAKARPPACSRAPG
jgi:subfamily B ATP-binding cassette protein MsbA